MDSASSHRSSRRAVVRGIAWTAPVVALAATAPAFASSTQRFSITSFTSRNSSNGSSISSIKYELKLTIKNEGTTAASPQITFVFALAYGVITGQAPTPVTVPGTAGWIQVVSADKRSIAYTNPTYVLAMGQSLALTFEPVNTSAAEVSSGNIDATVTATGWVSTTSGDDRI